MKLSLGQLPRLLSKRSSAGAFLRLWGALSELPPPGRQRIMEELHRNMRSSDSDAMRSPKNGMAVKIQDSVV